MNNPEPRPNQRTCRCGAVFHPTRQQVVKRDWQCVTCRRAQRSDYKSRWRESGKLPPPDREPAPITLARLGWLERPLDPEQWNEPRQRHDQHHAEHDPSNNGRDQRIG